jgi:hypothetical protein
MRSIKTLNQEEEEQSSTDNVIDIAAAVIFGASCFLYYQYQSADISDPAVYSWDTTFCGVCSLAYILVFVSA